MALDDPVGQHVANLPPAMASRITVRQLMAHVSGLPDYTKTAVVSARRSIYRPTK